MTLPNVFILTGAGISAESGLSTFRDKDGLWSRYKIEDVASIEGYRRDPHRVLEFYNLRRGAHGDVQPNAGHAALARLEQHWAARGAEVTICTQNIDNLHEKGGSKRSSLSLAVKSAPIRSISSISSAAMEIALTPSWGRLECASLPVTVVR